MLNVFSCFVASQAEDRRRGNIDTPLAANVGDSGIGGTRSSLERRQASIVLVDRTLDLAAAASSGGSLLQRVSIESRIAA